MLGRHSLRKVKKVHARRDVQAGRKEQKEYLDEMCFCSVFDSDGANTYQVTGAKQSIHYSESRRRKSKIRYYAPRSSTPQSESFSEIKRVTLAALAETRVALVEVPTTSSNERFSSKFFVESSILSGCSILRTGPGWGREERAKRCWR